jgi:hypothetical protein
MSLKQRAGLELLVAGKESVTNFHKRLKSICNVNTVDKNTAGRWTSRIESSERGQAEFRVELWHANKTITRPC